MITNYLNELKEVLAKLDIAPIQRLINKIIEVSSREGTIFIIGNGGSAATASHWVCDLNKGVLKNSQDLAFKRLKVISLADNTSIITAWSNDLSYNEIFSQQLKNFLNQGDLLIVMTGSGKSKNIIKAIESAKQYGAYIFSLLGSDGGEAKSISDDYILIPSKNYGIIEDVHLTIGHLITASIKKENNFLA